MCSSCEITSSLSGLRCHSGGTWARPLSQARNPHSQPSPCIGLLGGCNTVPFKQQKYMVSPSGGQKAETQVSAGLPPSEAMRGAQLEASLLHPGPSALLRLQTLRHCLHTCPPGPSSTLPLYCTCLRPSVPFLSGPQGYWVKAHPDDLISI